MSDSDQQSDDSSVRGPDPDLIIPSAHLGNDEFVDLVVETLESSEFIEVE